MAGTAQIPLFPAAKVAQEASVRQAENGLCYATFGQTNLEQADLERIVQAVPAVVAGLSASAPGTSFLWQSARTRAPASPPTTR